MKTIYKYPFSLKNEKFSLLLPKDFKFLRVQTQHEIPCIWAEVDKDKIQEEYKFSIHGTGQDIPDSSMYLGTFDTGPFVFHLYQL